MILLQARRTRSTRSTTRWTTAVALAWALGANVGVAETPGIRDLATCDRLVALLPASLDAATHVVIAVTLEQGGREIAYERSRVVKSADGTESSTTLERRGVRRPGRTSGSTDGSSRANDAFDLPCDRHELEWDDDGHALLTLYDDDPDAPVDVWSLRYALVEGTWRPVELSAPFTVRIAFVPVRGRFVTEFSEWRFAGPDDAGDP